MKKLAAAAYSWIIVGLLCTLPFQADAQSHRLGAGLSFASPVSYNTGETGNPGFSFHYWMPMTRAETFHLVPSITVYNPYKLETGYIKLYNYMFQADMNLQYAFFQPGTVRMIVFGGGNLTQLISDFTPVVNTGDESIEDSNDNALGVNLGAGLELYMSPQWDLNITGKYILSDYAQFVISIQAAYYFKKRQRAYRR
ncbi:MAG: hypothetical protein ACWGNV_08130 [Bacteroidales bacterium]